MLHSHLGPEPELRSLPRHPALLSRDGFEVLFLGRRDGAAEPHIEGLRGQVQLLSRPMPQFHVLGAEAARQRGSLGEKGLPSRRRLRADPPIHGIGHGH
jgi:hypothetical protein